MAEKWQTVGRPSKKSHSGQQASTGRPPVKELTIALNRYGTNQDDDQPKPEATRHTTSGSSDVSETTSVSSRSLRSRKTTSKKTKSVQPERRSFDECLGELDSETIHNFTEEASEKYSDNPQNLLKELAGQLQVAFQQVEPEKDHAFTNRPPGYPLSSLSTSQQEPLLSAVASCPPLAQEAIFRYCLDRLLGEVRASMPSHGTRIMLQLLLECNPSTCGEATQRINLLLQSSLSKVPEALSLLWAGLPHPRLHPTVVLGAWPELCLPLLYKADNVPKQVLNFAVDYTCLMLSTVGKDAGSMLLSCLPPHTAIVVFTSPQLVGKKTQGNVRQLIGVLQETLLGSCSKQQVAKYFTFAFKRLNDQPNSEVLQLFVEKCLEHSHLCFLAWTNLSSSCPQASVVLLRQLSTIDELPSPPHLAEALYRLCERGSSEEKGLAQKLLSQRAASFVYVPADSTQSSKRASRGWCSWCTMLVLLLSLVYLYFLWNFLVRLATHGPDEYLEYLKDMDVFYLRDKMWEVLLPFIRLFNSLWSQVAAYMM